MNFPFFIARRYLFARKSHNVINIISAISAIGMAVGTAALIIILSVYNGFDSLIKDSLSELDPDILVTPATQKYFSPGEEFQALEELDPQIAEVRPVLEEMAFAVYDGRQSVVKVRGMDNPELFRGETPLCNVSYPLASEMGINPNFVAMLELYYPVRDGDVSLSNPLASLNSVKVRPISVFNTGSESAATLVEAPIGIMRELLQSEDEVSAVQIWLQDGSNAKQTAAIVRSVQEALGDGFVVRDRVRQNESLFKMMKYEKMSIFLILIFIIIIITFNILGSLTMLIIEKKEDISTFKSMGATSRTLCRIFTLEGWLISLLGLAAGLVVGLLFAFLQQRLGIIKMPGGFIMSAYPVIIKASDVILTAISVAVVGYIVALIPAKKRIPA